MNIGQLKAILAPYPDDMVISMAIETPWGPDDMIVGLRDLLDRDTGKLDKTVLQIRHNNYGRPIGHAHLTDEERAKRRHEILDGLMDVRRPVKCANRRYTRIHGDDRLYHDYGGSQDTCYGTGYDPRLFAELEAEGLIQKYTVGYNANCCITDAGVAALTALDERAAGNNLETAHG